MFHNYTWAREIRSLRKWPDVSPLIESSSDFLYSDMAYKKFFKHIKCEKNIKCDYISQINILQTAIWEYFVVQISDKGENGIQ